MLNHTTHFDGCDCYRLRILRDDPVVKGLVEALRLTDAHDHGDTRIYGSEVMELNKQALSAYEEAIKEK
jgi:hypothetical protein